MRPEHVPAFAQILRRNKVRYIIVGGSAVLHFYPSESRAVDALLLAREYGRAVSLIDKDPAVVSFSSGDGEMASGRFLSRKSVVRFDLLNPEAFSGARPGDAFYDFVSRHGSIPTEDGRLATVDVVWYMRLVIEGEAWRVQVPKILRDIRAGAPWSVVDKSLRIARRFGTQERLRGRVHGPDGLAEATRLAGLSLRGMRRSPAAGAE